MFKEDKSKPSNLPTEVIMKQYPKNDYMNAPVADDMEYMDAQRNEGIRTAKRNISKKKY